MVKGMRELPYNDRLRRLNIFSFERRRLRGDLILAYNIFHGRFELPQAEFFEAPSERDLRGHDFKLRHRSFRLLPRKAACSVRLPSSWYKLSMETVNSPPRLTLLSDSWTQHGFPCSLPFLDSHATSIFILHGLRCPIVPLCLTNIFDLITLSIRSRVCQRYINIGAPRCRA